MIEYKGGHTVVTMNNSRLLIAHMGKAMIASHFNGDKVKLQNVYHV